MREIKFRAWHKEKNIMVYDNEDDTYGYWDGCCNSNVGMVNTLLNAKYYEQYIFMQYTGLKDKNGKEIYEGDIVTGRIKEEGIDVKGIVSYCECGYYLVKNTNDEVAIYYVSDIEVIGNIYENPELVKEM